MPVWAVCKPHFPDLKRGALATDARGCSLWRSLLERPPPVLESRVRDPLGELVRTRVGGVTLVPKPGMGVRFRGGECNGCMPVRAVCKLHSPDLKKRRSSD